MDKAITTETYADFLAQVKAQIKSSQAKAALSVNAALIALYWNLGAMIAANQALFAGRNNYIDQLAKDLQTEFPGIAGFSRTNLFSIRKFFLFYASGSVQQLVGLSETSAQQAVALHDKNPSPIQALLAQVPWGHHVLILNKVKDTEAALFYLRQTIEHGWSRPVLTAHIEQNLFARQGKAISNASGDPARRASADCSTNSQRPL